MASRAMAIAEGVRRPRLRLTVNGTITRCISAEITSQRGSRATTFRVELDNDTLSGSVGSSWIDAEQIDVSIDMGLAEPEETQSASWTSLVTGIVDRVSFDPVSRAATLDGRDYAARLIDLPLESSYLNRTCAEVARDLASRCGLAADVDETSGLVGQYYQIQHSKTVFGAFSRHANGWDLLAELAEFENYELWVDGTTLHFKQPVSSDQPFPVNFAPGSPGGPFPIVSVSDLVLDRTIGFAGPVQVRVDSWNSRQKQKVSASYPTSVVDGAKLFTVLKPNLLPDQAESIAKATYLQLRARKRTLLATMAGELDLSAIRALELTGTGTEWDTHYIVDRIVRHVSVMHGFLQHVSAVAVENESG